MIAEHEITEGCNVLLKDKTYFVKWKQTNKIILRPLDDVGFIEVGYDSVDPIFITPAILEKTGFGKINEHMYVYKAKDGKQYEINLSNPQRPVLKIDGKDSAMYNLALHELQQLVYTLSNEVCALKYSDT